MRLEAHICGPSGPSETVRDGVAAGSPHTIVFVQGWPDDATLWDDAVARLKDRYRCVRVNLPNFGPEDETHARVRWGPTTEEIVDALVALLREVAASGPVTLVLHDWGSYWGHAAHHRLPECVARVASLDVAPHFKPDLRGALGIMAYQGWLFAAYLAGGKLGDRMTQRFAKRAGAPAGDHVDAWMNYPYRNIWADILSGRAREQLRGYWPTCPLLFVYGEDKPFHFHSDAWLEHVRRNGGTVVPLRCGHWVPRDPAFVELLEQWLERTRSRTNVQTHASKSSTQS